MMVSFVVAFSFINLSDELKKNFKKLFFSPVSSNLIRQVIDSLSCTLYEFIIN